MSKYAQTREYIYFSELVMAKDVLLPAVDICD